MGPLEGLKVIEIASQAPAPFACMVLSDLGADVVRVDRVTPPDDDGVPSIDPLLRNRRSIGLDLKGEGAVDVVLRLLAAADVLVEGFRPGVMERLGLGPKVCHAVNPRLIYGRMTGWGQEGPMASRAGHDINYIAMAGALDPVGRRGERPVPPVNFVGDFGGGGMLLTVGILAALHERARSGAGQVVDAAMIDGSALLTASLHGMREFGTWSDERGTNLLDGGAPFYDTYETADGKWMSVGALEGRFYKQLLAGLGLDREELPKRFDKQQWPTLRRRFAEVFRQRTRDEWTAIFADLDACVAPVLAPAEVADDAHVRARDGFVQVNGSRQPAPAPRFSRTPADRPTPAPVDGEHTLDVLLGAGLDVADVAQLAEHGTIDPAWARIAQGVSV